MFLDRKKNTDEIKVIERLYFLYGKQMYKIAFSVLHNQSYAEDVVHDVFLNIIDKHISIIMKIKNEQDLRNYLLKATKNTAINRMYKNNRIYMQEELDDNDCAELSNEEMLDYICNKLQYEEVVKAIMDLPDRYKDVIYLHFVLELSIPDVAKLLEQPVDTTKKQLVRGKKKLLNGLNILERRTLGENE